MNEVDVAWFAGLFEGEGTFMIVKEKYAACIRINMTDLDVLEKVQSLFGGKVSVSYEAKDNWKKCYSWTTTIAEAERIVPLIYPYLMGRRRQRADQWLSLRENVRKSGTISDKVQSILDAVDSGLSQREVANMFSVRQPYVAKLVRQRKQRI